MLMRLWLVFVFTSRSSIQLVKLLLLPKTFIEHHNWDVSAIKQLKHRSNIGVNNASNGNNTHGGIVEWWRLICICWAQPDTRYRGKIIVSDRGLAEVQDFKDGAATTVHKSGYFIVCAYIKTIKHCLVNLNVLYNDLRQKPTFPVLPLLTLNFLCTTDRLHVYAGG